jgi:hypothetical protein
MNLFENRLIALARAGEQQRRDEEQARAKRAATPPLPEPVTPLWNGTTGLQRMVVSLRAQERREADERLGPHAPAPEPQSQIIDANYAQALGQKLQGAAAEAVQKVEARKAFTQTKTDSK